MTRTVLPGAHAEYDVDELNRVRGQSDYFANWQIGRFDYGFDKRWGGTGMSRGIGGRRTATSLIRATN